VSSKPFPKDAPYHREIFRLANRTIRRT
jgi:hypothetical protein